MVERALRMREAGGSKPSISIFALHALGYTYLFPSSMKGFLRERKKMMGSVVSFCGKFAGIRQPYIRSASRYFFIPIMGNLTHPVKGERNKLCQRSSSQPETNLQDPDLLYRHCPYLVVKCSCSEGLHFLTNPRGHLGTELLHHQVS